jgi:hypothetical protein
VEGENLEKLISRTECHVSVSLEDGKESSDESDAEGERQWREKMDIAVKHLRPLQPCESTLSGLDAVFEHFIHSNYDLNLHRKNGCTVNADRYVYAFQSVRVRTRILREILIPLAQGGRSLTPEDIATITAIVSPSAPLCAKVCAVHMEGAVVGNFTYTLRHIVSAAVTRDGVGLPHPLYASLFPCEKVPSGKDWAKDDMNIIFCLLFMMNYKIVGFDCACILALLFRNQQFDDESFIHFCFFNFI